MHQAFLYQARPDLFPQGYLTATERGLWALHYEEKAEFIKANSRNLNG